MLINKNFIYMGKIKLYIFIMCIYIFFRVIFLKIMNRLKSINQINFEELKKSDTLFILGSGSSINDLSSSDWEHISKHDSVGFNFWFLHDFVPSYYVYEESLDQRRNDIFYEILDDKKELYKNTVFLVKDIERKGKTLHKIPSSIKNNFYLAPSMSFTSNFLDENKFFYMLNEIIPFLKKVNSNRIRLLFNRKASLIYIVMLSYLLGYKKVVLCGVDLNNNHYFFDDVKYNNYKKPDNSYINGVHPTNDIGNKDPMTVAQILEVLYFKFLYKNINLYILSNKSELAKFLPIYKLS
ncbi:hypothetical protein ACLRAH_03740 [Glaesserella parasuis]|uniref:hypothetical protein n=2 Tax=Glaesserella parasuis TaxID=738 RepID=UPI0039FDCD75